MVLYLGFCLLTKLCTVHELVINKGKTSQINLIAYLKSMAKWEPQLFIFYFYEHLRTVNLLIKFV
jgi:hypothetical protein